MYLPRYLGLQETGVVVASRALGIRVEIGWLLSNNSDDQVACVSQARQRYVSSIYSLFKLHTDVLCINCQVRLQEGEYTYIHAIYN